MLLIHVFYILHHHETYVILTLVPEISTVNDKPLIQATKAFGKNESTYFFFVYNFILLYKTLQFLENRYRVSVSFIWDDLYFLSLTFEKLLQIAHSIKSGLLC